MTRFAGTLRRTNERLLIPQPARLRVLLEIRADMEDLYDIYRTQGLSAADAEQRAVDDCDLSDEALMALAAVHSGPWRRFLDGLSRQARSRFERGFLLLLLVFVLVVCGRLVLGDGFIRTAGPVAWPVLACLVVGLGLGGGKLYLLYLRQDHDPRRLRRGLGAVLGWAVAQPVVALAGNGIALFVANLRLIVMVEGGGQLLMSWLIASVATLIIALVGAIVCALLWYLAEAKVTAIEAHEAALLAEL
jgi:hypothetical protein